MPPVDPRRVRRYGLSLPVTIDGGHGSKYGTCQARTRDISHLGLYITVDRMLAVDSEINLSVALPASILEGIEVEVRVRAKVLRVEEHLSESSPKYGVAAQVVRYEMARTVKAVDAAVPPQLNK